MFTPRPSGIPHTVDRQPTLMIDACSQPPTPVEERHRELISGFYNWHFLISTKAGISQQIISSKSLAIRIDREN